MPPRLTLAAVAAAFALAPAAAQPPAPKKDDATVVAMTVSPALPPKPVSRFRLLPDYRDQQPGEMLSGFLKCFMEQDTFFNRENAEKRDKWVQLPLAELPANVREQAGIHGGLAYDPKYATLMVFIDQAARYTRVEWNEWFNLRRDGVYMLLPEVQKLRSLAQVLSLRLRAEIKNGEFDRAVVTVQTLFGMAKMLERHPTLIGNLVGIAVATIAAQGLEELVQQPGCPNLFWSLVDLPSPLLDLRYGMGGERVFLTAQLEDLKTAPGPVPDDMILKRLADLEEVLKVSGGGGLGAILGGRASWLQARAAFPSQVKQARETLLECGYKPALVEKWTPLQLLLVAEVATFETARDEIAKWLNLPYWEAAPGLREAERKLAADRQYLLAPLVPAIARIKESQTRLDQRLAALAVVEAVRLYAAGHGGELPPTLDAVKLPVPVDPATGKSFRYEVKGGAATVAGTPVRTGASNHRVFEVWVRK